MKAKTMLGLVVCASACVSLSAFANTTNVWFGVTVAGTVVTHVNVATNGVGTVSDSKISLNNVEQSSALVLTPDADFEGTNRTDGIYVIGASIVLNPCSTNDFKYEDFTNAKAGIVAGIDDLGATNYYGYANGAWIKLEGATVVDPGEKTDFRIVLNYRDNNEAYFIISKNDVDMWFGPHIMTSGETSAVANIKAWGTGSISSVTGAFEVAVSQYGDKKYGSVAEAMSVAVDRNQIKIVKEDGTVDEHSWGVADNGLQVWQCAALRIATNEQVTLSRSAKQNAGQITLAVGVVPEDGITVKYQVNGTGEFDADNIQIPMTTGTYTITPVFE